MPDLSDKFLGYALKQAQHALHRRMEEALRPLGMTAAQYAVLAALHAEPDQTNADLAEAAFLTPQSMQGVLSKLEGTGLVERRQDQHHGRRQLARLTESGHAMMSKAEDSVRAIEDALRKAAAPASFNETLTLIARLRDAMERFAEKQPGKK